MSKKNFDKALYPRIERCPVCGGRISSDALFCPHCGHPLRSNTTGKKQQVVQQSSDPSGFMIFIIALIGLFVLMNVLK